MRRKAPEGLTLGYPETQPQRQPGLSNLRRTGQQVQSLGKQILYEERDRFVGNGLQGIGVYGVEFFHKILLSKKLERRSPAFDPRPSTCIVETFLIHSEKQQTNKNRLLTKKR